MGYAGNTNPSYVIPTVVGRDDKVGAAESSRGRMDDLDFYVGDEVCALPALSCARARPPTPLPVLSSD